LTFATRFLNNDYREGPMVEPDSLDEFQDRQTILGSVFWQKRKFIKTKNLLSLGITEDVPRGYSIVLTQGRDFAQFETLNYTSLEIGYGEFFDKLGYVVVIPQYGMFWDNESYQNSILRLTAGFFTPLKGVNRWSTRQILRASFTKGFNLNFPISLNIRDEVRSINGRYLEGDEVFGGSWESVWFAPWYIYGFRFSPFAFYDFGYVQESRPENMFKSFYHGIGSGVRVRNESLLFQTLEVHFAWYPETAEAGDEFRLKFSLSSPIVFENNRPFEPRIIAFR
jgi:hemolysin activation/secretion protein